MRHLVLLPLAALIGLPATAQDMEPAMKSYYESNVASWADDPVLLDALRQSNEATAGRSEAEIEELDQKWRGEVGSGSTPTIDPVLQNSASEFLRGKVEESEGDITEILLIDANGFNAGISHVTTDFYQADEEQFTEVFDQDPGFVRVGEVEFDESSQTYQVRISFPVAEPGTDDVLGTMTVAVDPEAAE